MIQRLLQSERAFQLFVLALVVALLVFVAMTDSGEATKECDPPDDSGWGWCYEEREPGL